MHVADDEEVKQEADLFESRARKSAAKICRIFA